jgi:dienelactone hydrolase
MTRRDLFQAIGLSMASRALASTAAPALPGTQPLDWEGDLSVRMMDGAHRFVERKIDEVVAKRASYWKRDVSSRQAYEKSVEPNRARFRKIIGLVDERVPTVMERFADDDNGALVGETGSYRVYQVRWPVLEGVTGEGLLLEPARPPLGLVVAIPDADEQPEQLQFAYDLAGSGFEVIVPVLLDRTARWSGHPDIHVTDQTHREWIYRQAFHMGRHVIGYEVQKVLGAVDWFRRRDSGLKIGVAGYGEGGLIAFYSAAADIRIDAALVSGYFDNRQTVWSEPIYRNVWSLLREFGDAELATLIAPRGLVVEYSRTPEVTNQKGDLRTPPFDRVAAEFGRIAALIPPDLQVRRLVAGEGHAPVGPGSTEALAEFARALGVTEPIAADAPIPQDRRRSFDAAERQHRQVRELENHVQTLIRRSERVRENFFLYKIAPELADSTWTTELRRRTYPAAKFIQDAKPYRQYFRDEVLGRFDEPLLPPNPRTRRIYDKPKWTGYEVVLDVWPEVFAWGILLVPKDIKPGERRPVVVCQHGRQGIPQETVEGNTGYYHDFAARLAEEGFVTFAPHNLYRGEDRYRWLSRKGNGIQASLFSFIVSQHEQILRWLGSLPFVDAARIGFYGLSYGGETAVRVPTVLEGYALSICSGDFNSWTEKVAATDLPFGFMYTIEWEMPYFDMGSTFDYAEMTYLMIPRPFMVERGHNDRVSRDQWVAREYAKVRWLHAQLGLESSTQIEYFNGGHTINGEGTFDFLRRHLNWPKRSRR